MTEFKPGDRVRVTYETEYAQGGYHLPRGTLFVNHTVELIQAADDPSQDPVGTVREWGGRAFALTYSEDNRFPWVAISVDSGGANGHGVMEGTPIIGAVPGTPAAKAQKPQPKRVFRDSSKDLWFEVMPDSFTYGDDWDEARDAHRDDNPDNDFVRWSLGKLQRRYDRLDNVTANFPE
jgi:hypothetical protein